VNTCIWVNKRITTTQCTRCRQRCTTSLLVFVSQLATTCAWRICFGSPPMYVHIPRRVNTEILNGRSRRRRLLLDPYLWFHILVSLFENHEGLCLIDNKPQSQVTDITGDEGQSSVRVVLRQFHRAHPLPQPEYHQHKRSWSFP